MTTYPLPTLACTVDENGISAPSYADILASLQASYRQLYGADVYLEPDSQDGQWLAILASLQHDTNNSQIAAFNSFSPSTAQGVGLSSVVKINGLARRIASNSTVNVRVVGQAGTVISKGVVSDANNTHQWDLPSSVTIPLEGEVTVTAVCRDPGDIPASIGEIDTIVTPMRGWQSVINEAAASTGSPVESDAALRRRQSNSTSISAQSILSGIIAAIANLPGVERYRAYENDTNATDADGIPAKSIAIVVEGGTVDDIANAIAIKKTPGTGTYGTTSKVVIDPQGVPNTIRFFVLTHVVITVSIEAEALIGYVSTTGDLIVKAVAHYINSLDIDEDVYHSKLWSAANLEGSSATESSGMSQSALNVLSKTFNLQSIEVARNGDPLGDEDIAILFNEGAECDLSDITLIVT